MAASCRRIWRTERSPFRRCAKATRGHPGALSLCNSWNMGMRLLRRSELESRPQRQCSLLWTLAFVRHLFDTLSRDFFEKGQTRTVVISTQLCVEHKLFRLKQFHAQVI